MLVYAQKVIILFIGGIVNHVIGRQLKNQLGAIQDQAEQGEVTAIVNFGTVRALIVPPDWYAWFSDPEVASMMEEQRKVQGCGSDVEVLKGLLQNAAMLKELPQMSKSLEDVKKALRVL